MDLGLSGQVAIVGGASQGIGYAIAHTLAAEGAQVVMAARRIERLEAAAERIRAETGATAETVASDVRSAKDCAALVGRAVERFGRLDIVVNNDGAPPLGRVESFDDEAWSKAVDQNLMSVVRMVRHAVPHLRASGGGSIVNIAALSVLQPSATFGLSVATWAGVIGFAKTASLEHAPDNIRINTICPGLIQTPRIDKVFGSDRGGRSPEEVAADLARGVPLGRIGKPEEVAALAVFLASSRAGYITGSTFAVDGGRRAALL